MINVFTIGVKIIKISLGSLVSLAKDSYNNNLNRSYKVSREFNPHTFKQCYSCWLIYDKRCYRFNNLKICELLFSDVLWFDLQLAELTCT